jgi:Zn2+/Cd2+-exporting ATPase
VALGGRDEAEVLALAAALERRSEHPLVHAILSAADGAEPCPVSGFRAIAGRGAEGEVDGERYLIGSPRLFAESGISLDGADEALEAVERVGETPVVLGNADGPLAVFGLADSVLPDAKATIEALRGAGVGELVMLTGTPRRPPGAWPRSSASVTGQGFSPSRRSRRCASSSPSTGMRAWSATASTPPSDGGRIPWGRSPCCP